VCSQRQCDSIYIYFNSTFDLVLHSLLLDNLGSYNLSTGYFNWFCSYLPNRLCCVHFSEICSLPFTVLFGVPQGCGLGPSLLNIYINDPCSKIKHCGFLLFADNIKKLFTVLPRFTTTCFCSQILIPCKIFVLQIMWGLMLVKQKLSIFLGN
jgi:hypothetical protein